MDMADTDEKDKDKGDKEESNMEEKKVCIKSKIPFFVSLNKTVTV